MTEQAFEWVLTLTERRIAEMSYAVGGAWLSVEKVMHLRGERGPWAPDTALAMCSSMLAEIRQGPPEPRQMSHAEVMRVGKPTIEIVVKATTEKGLDPEMYRIGSTDIDIGRLDREWGAHIRYVWVGKTEAYENGYRVCVNAKDVRRRPDESADDFGKRVSDMVAAVAR